MRLLINADDLGYTPLINRAIFGLHRKARLFSTSLLVNLPHSQDAIDGLRTCPDLKVGLHLNLTRGRPLLSPMQIPTLVNADGEFWASRNFFVRAVTGRISLFEVEAELRAQIECIRDSGLLLTHLDSHSHWHVLPHLQQLVVNLAKRYQIPGIRQASLKRTLLPSALWLKTVPTKKHRQIEFSIPDYLLSLHHWMGSDGMPQNLFFSDGFQHLVSQQDISLEMVTHPGKMDDPDFPPDSLTAQRRQLEYDFLLSARFGKWLKKVDAVICSY